MRIFLQQSIITAGLLLMGTAVFAQGKDGAGRNDSIKGVPYFIRIGEGTGGIKLGESTADDVKKLFGKGKVRDEKSKTADKLFTFKTINYKKRGLKFFAIEEAPNTIYAIEVSMEGARTEKDITIGTSTQDDVIKAYGEPSYRSPESLGYDNLGVVFEFHHGVLQRVLLSKKKDK
jgi:hypothetical protein